MELEQKSFEKGFGELAFGGFYIPAITKSPCVHSGTPSTNANGLGRAFAAQTHTWGFIFLHACESGLLRHCQQPRRDHHGLQLLEQQLAGIRQVDLAHTVADLAGTTLKGLCVQIRHSYEAALVTHMHAVRVRVQKQALLQQLRGAVRDDAACMHTHTSATSSQC